MTNILILGGDGYLGWPLVLHFAKQEQYNVSIVDNLAKRGWEAEVGASPLVPLPTFRTRINRWNELFPKNLIKGYICDISENDQYLYKIFDEVKPDIVIHMGEQPSAPYSMISRRNCIYTQRNNVLGNLNVIMAILHHNPEIHLIKLGTMGEYGTPNIDIEEGWLNVTHNGRIDRVLYPKKPGSWYHLSKVHDSHNLEFACRVYNLRVTDLNQGIVYGIDTNETWLDPLFHTSFHYDAIFGTAINRFITQATIKEPITVYGNGSQIRGWINIEDVMSCIQISVENPPSPGEFLVRNQFTEEFSVRDLAKWIHKVLGGTISYINNPRVEQPSHYFNASNKSLLDLNLTPSMLSPIVIDNISKYVHKHKRNIQKDLLIPNVKWKA